MNEALSQEEITTRQVKKAPNPTGKGGFGDNPQNINPGGEPKNSLKNYVARKLAAMTDEQKDAWLKERKISGIDEWKMAEGNPETNVDLNAKVETTKIIDING